ncbi:MAG: hypothetical protein COU08_03045 [Candidatus Harrisonbacteria bacterium CG10_big_fil_rev_8_21_14_0_10_42_17]|uniref:ROK family protein n=1 Tax=Candidatus Harrisonbacteria bacterium CG10_big_fil_rev_8_21_14_0_10_42_17 TaxID=1974584 RepID=A0A2M6WHK2_9BACT|nr:MAG: hypothetical protein COU08_03045 [Candidatus Harrisonbacteria bacterium CG10_big_fil_rev_8_21_14_0_10_42_17]
MYLLFDIGGTKMRLAVSEDGATFGEPIIISTPKNFDEGMKVFSKLSKTLSGGRMITFAGGGVPGPLDAGKSCLLASPNLSGWVGKPLRASIQVAVGAPTFLENDTAIVGLGEAVHGAGRGYAITVYVTISTGVNGVRIVDGVIDRNAFGFEIGHQVIAFSAHGTKDGDLPICLNCPVPGHLEAYVSGTAIAKRYGKKPYDIHDEAIWDTVARHLAYGLNNTIVHWSPHIVVLGGSMMKEIGIPLDRVQHHLRETLTIFPVLPDLKKAELKDIGGLYGALAFLKQKNR